MCERGRSGAGAADPVATSGSEGTSGSTVEPLPPVAPATDPYETVPAPDTGVYGWITDGGRSVPGAMVQPAPGPGHTAPEREVFATSAPDGSYAVGLTPGAWVITISADGYRPVELDVTVPAQAAVQADATLIPSG